MGLIPEFEVFFSGYGSYHHNPMYLIDFYYPKSRNKAIHIICVPLILISLLQILMHSTFTIETQLLYINFPLIFACIVSLVYIKVDFLSGCVSALLYISSSIIGAHYYYLIPTKEGLQYHMKIMWILHGFCWILQFIGHGFFERRAPALLDNLLQVFVAPDFVVIEVYQNNQSYKLMFMLGYKKDIKLKCDKRISENIEQFRKEKVKSQ